MPPGNPRQLRRGTRCGAPSDTADLSPQQVGPLPKSLGKGLSGVLETESGAKRLGESPHVEGLAEGRGETLDVERVAVIPAQITGPSRIGSAL